jgi:hypothetical protein
MTLRGRKLEPEANSGRGFRFCADIEQSPLQNHLPMETIPDVTPELKRCRSTRIFRGEVVRCHERAGHDSAHHTRDIWWPNERGFPFSRQGRLVGWSGFVLGLLFAAAALGGIVAWLVLHR